MWGLRYACSNFANLLKQTNSSRISAQLLKLSTQLKTICLSQTQAKLCCFPNPLKQLFAIFVSIASKQIHFPPNWDFYMNDD